MTEEKPRRRVNASRDTWGWKQAETEPWLHEEVLGRLKAGLADPDHPSDREIALRVGVNERDVWRLRKELGIPNFYQRRRDAGLVIVGPRGRPLKPLKIGRKDA